MRLLKTIKRRPLWILLTVETSHVLKVKNRAPEDPERIMSY